MDRYDQTKGLYSGSLLDTILRLCYNKTQARIEHDHF